MKRLYLNEQIYQRGASGAAVQDIQEDLNRLGVDPQLAVDGVFGPKTEQSVTDYQYWAGIAVDGIVGPETKASLKEDLKQKTPITPVAANQSGDGTNDEASSGDDTTSTSPTPRTGRLPDQSSGLKALATVASFGGIGYYLWRNYA